jgi:hypothetical protein
MNKITKKSFLPSIPNEKLPDSRVINIRAIGQADSLSYPPIAAAYSSLPVYVDIPCTINFVKKTVSIPPLSYPTYHASSLYIIT